jgi:membrane-anchored glycerophosphoryl diester phosphodiesterase (GDPDase)
LQLPLLLFPKFAVYEASLVTATFGSDAVTEAPLLQLLFTELLVLHLIVLQVLLLQLIYPQLLLLQLKLSQLL